MRSLNAEKESQYGDQSLQYGGGSVRAEGGEKARMNNGNLTLDSLKNDVLYIPDLNDTLVTAAVLDFPHSLR